jgi:hypothetical protein
MGMAGNGNYWEVLLLEALLISKFETENFNSSHFLA